MSKLSDRIKKAKKTIEINEKFKDNGKFKEKLEVFKIKNGETFTTPKQKERPFIDVLESDKISIDEARAYYVVICKKRPKHDKIQTKNFLINEIKKKLEQSKTK